MNKSTPWNSIARYLPLRRRKAPIFIIGFNKCGTNSVSQFLEDGGVPVIHWDGGKLALAMKARMDAGEDPIADYPLYRGFSDLFHITDTEIIEAHEYFEYFHKWHPDALFILNTRDSERWISSRLNHPAKNAKKSLQSRYASAKDISENAVPNDWRKAWDAHHAKARAFFANNDRFIEFNIESDNQVALQSFMQHHLGGDWSHNFGVLNRNPKTAAAT